MFVVFFSGDTGFIVLIFLSGGEVSELLNLSLRTLSVDDESGVLNVDGCGGLLLGEEEVPWVAHLASSLVLLFDPGGRPTVEKNNSLYSRRFTFNVFGSAFYCCSFLSGINVGVRSN